MFDNLRQKSAQEAEFLSDEPVEPAPPKPKVRRARRAGAAGLTPGQRFMLALILFLNVTVLGVFALLVFEKISLERLLFPF
ncbi:MAG: hypothetical protein IT318_13415 [Anaerolineales bacterium]|nr:hypothetical protein [Anaerolineales bacterium]